MLAGCPSPSPPTTPPPTPTPTEDTDVAPETTWLDISDDLDAIKGNRAPGMVAAVADAEGILALGVAGRRQRGEDARVAPDDLFHLGSITKVYTALLVARLVDAGELSWELTLGEVFNDIHPDWEAVTLRMLMRHEGGATTSIAGSFLNLWNQLYAEGDTDILATRAHFASTLLAEPPARPPGSPAYSNAGVMLVGAAIEARRGIAWEDDVTTWVLEPLGQTDCVFGPPTGDQPWGHDASKVPADPTELTSDNPPALGPAGTLACSVSSLVGLGQVYLKAIAGDTSFVSAESLAILTEANAADYVPGMIRDEDQPWARGPAYVMTGSNTFWFSTIWMSPGTDRVYAVISNRGATESATANNDVVVYMLEERL